MKAAPFEYVRAHSLEQACAHLDADVDAMVITAGHVMVMSRSARLACDVRLDREANGQDGAVRARIREVLAA